MCTGFANQLNQSTPDVNITITSDHCQHATINNTIWFNISTIPSDNNDTSYKDSYDNFTVPDDIPSNLLFLRFNSIQFSPPKDEDIIVKQLSKFDNNPEPENSGTSETINLETYIFLNLGQ